MPASAAAPPHRPPVCISLLNSLIPCAKRASASDSSPFMSVSEHSDPSKRRMSRITICTPSIICGEIRADDDWTDIFIYPGYQYKCIDALITNFHLPESTLIMLVSAFCGYENTMNAYRIAVQEKYRFFSFGDAMLIE